MDKISTARVSETKNLLTRRTQLDSIIEIKNCPSLRYNNEETLTVTPISQKIAKSSLNEETNKPCLLSSLQAKSDLNNITIMNSDNVLNLVVQTYSLEEVLNKYFSIENALHVKSPSILAKFISNWMFANSKIKEKVLETLSEDHSKDFLDYAVQENLSSVVCDRLNLNSVIDYICAKSKINSGCRNNLFLQIPDIIKQIKLDSERMNFIKCLFQSGQLSDVNILDLITSLVQIRSTLSDLE